MSIVEEISRNFIEEYRNLVERGLLTEERLRDYPKYNVHSLLQYCLIISGEKSGLIAIPEYKIRLKVPINKKKIDTRFSGERENMWNIRVDIGYFKNTQLLGIGEVYTPDEIHGCLPSTELEEPWVSPYHKLLHMTNENNLEDAKINFIVVVNGFWKLPEWKDARRHSIDKWTQKWYDFMKLLQESGYKIGWILIKGINNYEVKVL